MEIDMSLKNDRLYAGCKVEVVGGRDTLVTPVAEAANIVGKNANAIVEATPRQERAAVTLTGPMAVWAYLIVFHAVVHAFGEVWYSDGRNDPVLVSKH